jgi:hypothetical protein
VRGEKVGMRNVGLRYIAILLVCFGFAYAENYEADMDAFDDAPAAMTQKREVSVESDMDGFEDETPAVLSEDKKPDEALMDGFEDEDSAQVLHPSEPLVEGLSGELTQKIGYAWHNEAPHNGLNSFKSELFLDYEHKFENAYRLKINAKAYHDFVYKLRGEDRYSDQEREELENEIELFDAYLEGKITEKLDFKIGRQVVVWGRSDTIRVTDILNPLDNRTPGIVDIEDLRLPVTMAKFDYFIGEWRITPIVVLEQRFSKNPPFGGDFYPMSVPRPEDKSYSDVTYALSIGGEFEGWDVSLYAADLRDDTGYLAIDGATPRFFHDKVQMYGGALNILSGSWLLKSEIAHFEHLKYTTTPDKELSRTDMLIGCEYNGIADTMIGYDLVSRNTHHYDRRLLYELNPLKKHIYQHALRVSSEFFNASLKANYLLSLYGEKLDQGGFQRVWMEYDLADGISLNAGIVDYIGGSTLFDAVKNNDRIFADISYSF